MSNILVPYISGQYSGFNNDLLMTTDKHKVIYNGSFDDFGMWQARLGTTRVRDLGSGDVLGMHDAAFSDGTHVHLATVGDKIFNAQTGNEFSSHAYTTGKVTEFANFLNLVFVVNGADAMSTVNSSGTYEGTTNVSGAPVSNYVTEYGSRIWTNDTSNLRRVHRSNSVSSGAITWDTNLEFFDVDGSGDYLTGLHKARNTLMAFTNIDVEIRYFTRARLGILTNVGTLSSRSIITKRGTTFWSHPGVNKGFAGIYAYSGTGSDEAQLVSTPIQDVFDAMTDTQWDKMVAWEEGSSLVWYLGGDVIMDYGVVNTVALNLKNNGWSTWNLPYTIKVAGTFLNSTTLATDSHIGDDEATIYRRDGTKDEKQAGGSHFSIESFLQSFPLTAPENPFQYNKFNRISVKGNNFGSLTAMMKVSKISKPFSLPLKESFYDPSVHESKIDAKGNSIDVKLSLNDEAVQSIKGYNIEYEQEGGVR